MSRRQVSTVAVIAVLAAGLLTACDPPPPEPSGAPSTSASAPQPSASATPEALTALPADAVLGVSAVVTDTSGASLQLTAIVHRSVAADSADGTPLAALMTEGCQGALDAGVYADQLWSFAAIDVTASPLSGTWPSGALVGLRPGATPLALASDGVLVEDPAAASDVPRCVRGRFLPGAGSGRLVVGFEGDTDAAGAAGAFTRWANTRYGFTASGATLSACAFVVTELGSSLGGGAPGWTQKTDARECTTGSGTPDVAS
ncbi:MAG: hypothetical protein DI534_07505 [Leifsonia xyli]|nr:MAG: hypothetical protein DI534_07505 [Leifsonia xyli]